jgi:hypothetical protein
MAGVRVKLENVRLSFPEIFQAKAIDGGAKPRYSATFLFEPNSEAHKTILRSMLAAAKIFWGEKGEETFQALLKKSSQICLHDGSEKDYDGYEGMMYISAHNYTRPGVFDSNRDPITSESLGRPYSGCYVNCVVEFYGQRHPKSGNRINCSLSSVQFLRDGPAFTGGRPGTVDDYDDVSDIGSANNDPIDELL